jgi:hypothetical protein
MFGLKPDSLARSNKLFGITLHVERGSNEEMPEELAAAYVPIFVGAADHEEAAVKAVKSVTRRGFRFVDVADRRIYELDPTKWDDYVYESWPDFVFDFPSQDSVIGALDQEFLFTGPFATCEEPAHALH